MLPFPLQTTGMDLLAIVQSHVSAHSYADILAEVRLVLKDVLRVLLTDDWFPVMDRALTERLFDSVFHHNCCKQFSKKNMRVRRWSEGSPIRAFIVLSQQCMSVHDYEPRRECTSCRRDLLEIVRPSDDDNTGSLCGTFRLSQSGTLQSTMHLELMQELWTSVRESGRRLSGRFPVLTGLCNTPREAWLLTAVRDATVREGDGLL